ncbi:RNA-binding protein [Mucilaginibacter terrigena]|uniref:RNA-binding protein n=1 Tax=Mucilaginibacter terrigena TaxID=2492395 RepID=A0A4Q5LRC9_9SPHI|nr:RNA-binding protein [Mucilaginibacter terrigena]RYU91987.1 RNA-binding protein [Mucilaginibacter terrigena]
MEKMVKLFVGGFPLEMTELELVQMVALYGEVSTIKIVRDKKTKICKGYAFIEVTDYQGAKQIIEALNGTTLAGRQLTISIKEDEPEGVKPPVYMKIRRPDEPVRAKRPRRV